jgi:hypothetical protein
MIEIRITYADIHWGAAITKGCTARIKPSGIISGRAE